MKAFVSVLLVAAATAQTFDFMGTNKPTHDFGRYGYGNHDLSLAQLLSVTGKTYGTTGKVFPFTKTGYYPTRVLTINELMNTQLFQEYLNIPLFRQLVTVPVFQTYLETIKFQQYWTNPTFMNIFRNPVLFYKYIYPTVVTIDTNEYPTVTPFNVPTYENDVLVNNLVEKIYRTLFINGGVKPDVTEVKTDVKVEVETPRTNNQENTIGKFVDPITGEIKYNNGDFNTVEEKVTPIVAEVKVTKPVVENFIGEDTIKEALLKRPFLNRFFYNKEIPTSRFEVPRTPEMIKTTNLPIDIARIRRDSPALFNTLLNYYKFATEEPTYNKYNNGLYKNIDPVLAIILAHHIYNEVPMNKDFLLNKEYPINKEFLLLNKEYPTTKDAFFTKEYTTPFNMESLLKKEYLPFNKDFLLNKEYPVNKEMFLNKEFTKEFYPFNKETLLKKALFNKEYPFNKDFLLNKEYPMNLFLKNQYTKEYTPFDMETLLKKEYLPFNKDFLLNKEYFPLKKELTFEKPEEKIFYNTLFNALKKNIMEEMKPTTTEFLKNFEYGMKPEDKLVRIPLTYTPTYKTYGEDEKIVPKTIVV